MRKFMSVDNQLTVNFQRLFSQFNVVKTHLDLTKYVYSNRI